jgi:aspartyl protease family protein
MKVIVFDETNRHASREQKPDEAYDLRALWATGLASSGSRGKSVADRAAAVALEQLSGRAGGGRVVGGKPASSPGLKQHPGECARSNSDRSGIVVGWALRWVLLCCGIAVLACGILNRVAATLSERAAPSAAPAGHVSNTIVYTANERGHVIVDAAVNGAPVRMLVDTGASFVALTPADARAAGIDPDHLLYSARVNTANGAARMAPVTLREIRIGQLSVYDVPAAVMQNLNVSLLGMSFLTRLQGYEMRDGKLTINW